MRVFITGATGFIGLAVTKELVAAGHEVLGLSRSPEKDAALIAAGGKVHRGSLEDMDALRSGIDAADGVIHLAFNHDFSKFVQNCEDDRRTIRALGSFLVGTQKPLVITSGTGMTNTVPGQVAVEDGPVVSSKVVPRAASEEAGAEIAANGVNVSVVRLPQVHDTRRQGLISLAIGIARDKGYFAYVGDGTVRWPAAHVLDVAKLYRLAIEKAAPGAKYNAVAEEGVRLRDMVEVLGERLQLPVKSITAEEAPSYFGWLATLAQQDLPVSSAKTRRVLGWEPTGPGVLEDLARFES